RLPRRPVAANTGTAAAWVAWAGWAECRPAWGCKVPSFLPRCDRRKALGDLHAKGLSLLQLPIRKGLDDLSPLARIGGCRGVTRHLEPEARRDFLGDHDARWRAGPGSRSLHPRGTPRCFDHRSHGVLRLVDGTTRVDAETHRSASDEPGHEDEDGEDDEKEGEREQGTGGEGAIRPETDQDQDSDSNQDDGESQADGGDLSVVGVRPFRGRRFHLDGFHA